MHTSNTNLLRGNIYIHTCVAHVTIILRQRKDHKSETKRTAMGSEWIRERKMKEKIYNL